MKFTNVFLLAFLFCATNGVAQEKSPEKSESKESKDTAVVADTNSTDSRLYKGLNLIINGGASVMTSSIDGIGMSSKLPSTFGTTYGAGINYGASESTYNYQIKYQVNAARYEDVSGVTPTSFNKKNVRIDAGVWSRNYQDRNSSISSFGLGYFYKEHSADRIAPAVAATLYLSGPALYAGITNNIGSKSFLESSLIIGFPNWVQESNTVTGRYKFGILGSAIIKIVYPYTENLDLSFGLTANYDYITFSGSGSGAESRGVSEATEQFIDYALPFELRFRF